MASFKTIILDAEKGIEVGVADALKIFGVAQSKSPAAITALTALAGAIETALSDTANTNASTLTIQLPTDVADIKAVWGEGKALLQTLGIK